MDNIELSISKNKLEARIILITDFKELSVEYVLKFLNLNKVTYGIKKDNIHQFVIDKKIGTSIVVASGFAVVEEKPIQSFLVFDRSKVALLNKANLKEMHLEVVTGQPLVKLSKKTYGKPGRNVFDSQIEIKKNIDDILKIGVNTQLDAKDKSLLIASTSGKVILDNGIISVLNSQEITKNIDSDIMIMGSLVLTGDVLDNVKIKVSENLFIKGNVYNAQIEVGGTLTIEGNVFGKKGALIKASKNIDISYVENFSISTNGNINIAIDCINCILESAGEINILGKIIGGFISSEKKISSNEIGDDTGIKTIVQTGVDSRKERLLKNLISKLTEAELKQKKLNAVVIQLGENLRKGKLSKEDQDKYRNLLSMKKKIDIYLDQIILKRDKLSSIIGKNINAEIIVSSYIYVGVEIRIQGISTKINQILSNTKFRMFDWTIIELL